jgi:peptide/nickel transport system permease protein
VTGLVLRRIALGLLTLWLVSVVVFAATQALPGDAARSVLGQTATPERLADLREELNLDESVLTQYTTWLGGVVTGDLGNSLAAQVPVWDVLDERLANTAFLVFVAALMTIPASLAIGIVSAVKRDRAVDHALSTGSLLLAGMPEFVVGIALVLVFATSVFDVLPAVTLLPEGDPVWLHPEYVVLPAATLALAVVPYMSRIMRASMIEVLESDYVEMARLKGLSQRKVILRHALPNALVPSIQVTALQLAWLAGGVVLVEFVFRYSGVGEALVNAVDNRDIPVVQALTLLLAGVYVVLNVIADIATILVTPKLRTALR